MASHCSFVGISSFLKPFFPLAFEKSLSSLVPYFYGSSFSVYLYLLSRWSIKPIAFTYNLHVDNSKFIFPSPNSVLYSTPLFNWLLIIIHFHWMFHRYCKLKPQINDLPHQICITCSLLLNMASPPYHLFKSKHLKLVFSSVTFHMQSIYKSC